MPPHPGLPPVIAIDGPSASGKGTVARRVAERLGLHFLDSGALYRLVALAALKGDTSLSDEKAVAGLARALNVRFDGEDIILNQELVTDSLRLEAIGAAASTIAALPAVREALLERQHAFRRPPGLVADGRDMGSVVFPDADLKIYLTATPEERAVRRYKQLKQKGMDASMTALLQDIRARDERDSARAIAPLQKGDDAILLDTTGLSVEAAVEQILARYAAATRAP
jgi:cytidylate kinase